MNVNAELKVSADLRIRCVGVFKGCKEFESPSSLRAFALFAHLELTDYWIPRKDELDCNVVLINLLRHGRTWFEPVLLDLLKALARQYEGDWRQAQCKELEEEIKKALQQPGGSDQDQVYQQLAVISSTSDGGKEEKRAARWIKEAGDDLDERALRISLAVFHGTSFETIERAKNDLLEALQELVPPPPPPAPDAPAPAPAPHAPLMQRLKKAGAYETDGQAPDWKKVIELKEPELASEVLIHVWQTYRETKWRQKLIGWLTSYAGGRPADVRTRAAVAAGILAVKDYRFVRENLLDLWVERDDAKYRTAIGMALGILAREDNWATEVQRLLREWSESSEQSERWAALRAYIYVGAYCQPVSEVIARWRSIADSEYASILIQVSEDNALRLNNPMHMSLMDAMVRFFVDIAQMPDEKKRPLFAGILSGLKNWVGEAKIDVGLGLFMFTTLGRLIATGNGEPNGAPVLLQLISDGLTENEAEYRSQLAGIFEVVMRNGATIMDGRELLCVWLRWVDGLQESSPAFESRINTLFNEIIAADKGSRARGKLAACLRECGRNRTAQRILSGLKSPTSQAEQPSSR